MARTTSSTALDARLEARAARKTSGGMTVYDLLDRQRPQIEKALPNVGLTAERLTRVLQTQIRLNDRLGECSPASLLGAVMLTAQLGLEPGPLGQAYFVPYYNSKAERYECQFILGYKGMIALAWRSGQIVISAYTICANDLFEFDYGSGYVKHTYKISQQRGETTGFWAKAVMPNGSTAVLVMTKAEVDAHRKRSAAKDSGPWVTDYDAMGKKTVIRVLCSQIPLNAEAQQAIAADETAVVFDGDEGVIEVSEAPVIDVEPEPEQEVGADG